MACELVVRPLTRRQRGSAQIEFILTFFTIMFVLYGVMEIAMAVYAMNVLGDAAREGVRYAIVHGSGNTNCSGGATCDVDGDNVKAVVQDYARFCLHDTSGMTVTVTYTPGNAPLDLVKVDVNYPYAAWIKLPWGNPTLKASAQGRIVH
jgi:Flp pilus assembly protein TadG